MILESGSGERDMERNITCETHINWLSSADTPAGAREIETATQVVPLTGIKPTTPVRGLTLLTTEQLARTIIDDSLSPPFSPKSIFKNTLFKIKSCPLSKVAIPFYTSLLMFQFQLLHILTNVLSVYLYCQLPPLWLYFHTTQLQY